MYDDPTTETAGGRDLCGLLLQASPWSVSHGAIREVFQRPRLPHHLRGEGSGARHQPALRDVLTQRLFPDVQALPKQLQNAALAVLNGAGIPTDDDDIKAPFLIALQEVVDAKIKDSQQPLSEKKVDKVVLDIQRVAGKILGMAMQMP